MITSGFKILDKALGGGLEKGKLYLIGSRPSMGKTLLAGKILDNQKITPLIDGRIHSITLEEGDNDNCFHSYPNSLHLMLEKPFAFSPAEAALEKILGIMPDIEIIMFECHFTNRSRNYTARMNRTIKTLKALATKYNFVAIVTIGARMSCENPVHMPTPREFYITANALNSVDYTIALFREYYYYGESENSDPTDLALEVTEIATGNASELHLRYDSDEYRISE